MKKFELTAETKGVYGRTLHRIRALKDFGDVKAGDLGGWIEREDCLSPEGNCWVSDNAWVYGDAIVSGNAMVSGDARVYGNAWVYGNARVFGNVRVFGNARVYNNAHVSQDAHVFWISQIGSRFGTTTFFRNKQNGISVSCGCFNGTLPEFEQAVNKTHGDSKHGRVYRLAIEMAKAQIDLTDKREGVEADIVNMLNEQSAVGDLVQCSWCEKIMIVNIGEDVCPACNTEGTLSWIEGCPKEMEG